MRSVCRPSLTDYGSVVLDFCWELSSASLPLLSESSICHHKCVCLAGGFIRAGYFLRNWRWGSGPCSLPHNCLKKFRQRACSQNRTITRDLCEHGPGAGLGSGLGTRLETRVSPCPRLSAGPADICVPDTCFSVSTGIVFLPSTFTDHYPRHPLLSLAEHGTWGEGFSYSGKFPVLLGLSHKLLFSC